jgi:hypothetical protein
MVLKLGGYCFINDAEDAPRAFEVDLLAHSKGFHILPRYCAARVDLYSRLFDHHTAADGCN